jgi:hypothetical protein
MEFAGNASVMKCDCADFDHPSTSHRGKSRRFDIHRDATASVSGHMSRKIFAGHADLP